MFSIIFVEDQHTARETIVRTIQWSKLGFRLVGVAENGQDAVQLIELFRPEVVLTDIKTPFTDGIALAQWLGEKYPLTKIVLLTGAGDFDCAISLLKLNVFAYLLKPFPPDILTAALQSVYKKLEEERSAALNANMSAGRSDRMLDYGRANFLVSIITGGAVCAAEEKLRKTAGQYHLQLQGQTNLLFAVDLSIGSFDEANAEADDVELLKLSVARMMRSAIKKYTAGEIFVFGRFIIAILSDSREKIESQADVVLREIHQSIARFYGSDATVGVGQPFELLSQAADAFTEAVSALEYRGIPGGGRIIRLSDMQPEDKYTPVLSETRIAEFCAIIKTGRKAEMEMFVDGIFAELREIRSGLRQFRICTIEIYSAALRTLKGVFSDNRQPFPEDDFNFGAELFCCDLLCLHTWIIAMCGRVMDQIANRRKGDSTVLAEEGYEYMRKSFCDPAISLKSVSAFLHVSANYFSTVFKKETGLSFTDALVNIRMTAARELLLTSRKKVFEVAMCCGYDDQHYFSYCYKKHFGVSPSEDRASHKAARKVFS